jgi:hypothetical protein
VLGVTVYFGPSTVFHCSLAGKGRMKHKVCEAPLAGTPLDINTSTSQI